jgi:hypothetical protein
LKKGRRETERKEVVKEEDGERTEGKYREEEREREGE